MVFPIRRASACVPKVLESSLGRVPQAPRRLHTYAWTQRWFVQFFGSGLICPRTQTCCALKSSAPSGARQDNCADLLGLQTRRGSNHSAAHVSESNSRSNVFQIRRATACVPSRWKVLSGEFRRRPTEFVIKLRNPDRVGRRGLSEPREDFSRLPTKCCSIPWLDSVARFRGCISR